MTDGPGALCRLKWEEELAKKLPSRRTVVAGVAAAPILSTPLAAHVPATELASLGQQFKEIVQALDNSNWGDSDALTRLAKVETAILSTQAATMEDLFVKARAACWALLGDLDPMNESTTDKEWRYLLSATSFGFTSQVLSSQGAKQTRCRFGRTKN